MTGQNEDRKPPSIKKEHKAAKKKGSEDLSQSRRGAVSPSRLFPGPLPGRSDAPPSPPLRRRR
jgi:hypothetical protein